VETVRSFNRFFTRAMGLLGEGLLDTPYSLTEARLIFELGRRDAIEVAGSGRPSTSMPDISVASSGACNRTGC
jgi:hypothetical protein